MHFGDASFLPLVSVLFGESSYVANHDCHLYGGDSYSTIPENDSGRAFQNRPCTLLNGMTVMQIRIAGPAVIFFVFNRVSVHANRGLVWRDPI